MLPRREGVVNRHFQIGPDGALGYRFGGGDLGQMSNYTALTALEAHAGDNDRLPGYYVRHLHRFDLGTSYLRIVDEVCTLIERRLLRGIAGWCWT